MYWIFLCDKSWPLNAFHVLLLVVCIHKRMVEVNSWWDIVSFSNLLFDFSGKVEDVSKVQTLLFSATLPGWVKEVRFLSMIVLLE